MKVFIDTLGCPKNVVDSELMQVEIQANPILITDSVQDAEVVIVNTCAFIQEAVEESLSTIFSYIKQGKRVIVTGCLLGRYKETLKDELREVKDWVEFEDQINIAQYLNKKSKSLEKPQLSRHLIKRDVPYAYVKIAEGCNRACSYCAIPLIRGPLKSRSYISIIEEIQSLVQSGVKEIILVAQDLTAYGGERKNNLLTLLKKIVKIPLDFNLRLLYLYPADVTQELIDFILSQEKIFNYFDIPVQHSEKKILRKMNRFYDKEKLLAIIESIRKKAPDAVFRTTLLVGFPGETENDIKQLKSFVKNVRFNHLGIFTYFREEGTPGYNLGDPISQKIKQKRLQDLMLIQQKNSSDKLAQFQDEILTVRIDKKYDENYFEARNYYFAPEIDGLIFVKKKKNKTLKKGKLVKIKIIETTEYDLYGELL